MESTMLPQAINASVQALKLTQEVKMSATTPDHERRRLAGDAHRPSYHFLPPSNWMNDPNGISQWGGRYHLFYQYNPLVARWGVIHWGHAVSADLVHWDDLPVALAPTPGGPDADGCWSGCIVNNGGVPTMLYTGLRAGAQRPCLATSDDGLLTWHKYPGNPVIAEPPAEADARDFRDHCVWKEGDSWYQVIGGKIDGVGGAALLYRSRDLIAWEYLHPLCVGAQAETGTVWECPDFFPLGDKHVLLISPIPLKKTLYMVGTYADHRFTPEHMGDLDAGGHFYAPQSMRDAQGRRLVWGWLWEGRDEPSQLAAGWAGVMSLPRVLTLLPDGTVGSAPATELAALREHHQSWRDLQLTAAADVPVDVQGAALEISVTFLPNDATAFGIDVRRSADGSERTRIIYDSTRQRLEIDRSLSSANAVDQHDVYGDTLALEAGEPLTLRVLADHSVIEVFANGQVCLTSRVYPSETSLSVALFAEGGSVDVPALDVWTMRSIWTA
jgi:beta-fructofuranosidase